MVGPVCSGWLYSVDSHTSVEARQVERSTAHTLSDSFTKAEKV